MFCSVLSDQSIGQNAYSLMYVSSIGHLCLYSVNTACAVGVFIFFGMWHCLAGLFVYFLLPETRGIPLEQVRILICIAFCKDSWRVGTTLRLSICSTRTLSICLFCACCASLPIVLLADMYRLEAAGVSRAQFQGYWFRHSDRPAFRQCDGGLRMCLVILHALFCRGNVFSFWPPVRESCRLHSHISSCCVTRQL